MMDLVQLLMALSEKEVRGSGNPAVVGVTQDSRCVQPGYVFVCISGYQLDGHDYIEDAIRRGAVAVVIERELPVSPSLWISPGTSLPLLNPPVWVRVRDARESLALLSAAIYQHPSQNLRVIGITGTNGKTTTSYLVASILEAAGFSVGLTNTLTCRIRGDGETGRGGDGETRRRGDREMSPCPPVPMSPSPLSLETPAVRTTPESVDLQRILRQMVDQGCHYAVVEVSSHSLVLNRVLGIEFDVGVLTNITSDHLDFHKTLTEYRRAKQRLFSGLGSAGSEKSEERSEKREEFYPSANKQRKAAVLNLDDPSYSVIKESTSVPVFSYGFQTEASIRADRIIPSRSGIAFEVHTQALAGKMELPVAKLSSEPWMSCELGVGQAFNSQPATRNPQRSFMEITSRLTGLHNVSNILAAIGVGLAEGIDPDKIQEGIRRVSSVPGRFETIDCGQDFWVVVDFAHTTDALQNLLQTARHLGPRRIMTVFGCGGDRDRSKRFPMGQVAATFSDRLIITSDNSRSEDPATIARQIEEGVCSVLSTCNLQFSTPNSPPDAGCEAEAGKPVAGCELGVGKAFNSQLVQGYKESFATRNPQQSFYEIILDRYQAIQKALSWAEAADMVLIAGKGHEQYQIIGSQRLPFDDRQVARHILTSPTACNTGVGCRL